MGYDHEKLRQYILGELSEEESDEFDELVVCDTDFADELSAVEAELLDGFVNGELDSALAEKVRRHYSATVFRRQKLAFAETLRESAVVAPVVVEPLQTAPSRSSWSFLSLFSKPVWASFAVIALMGAAVLVWQLRGRDESVAVTIEKTPTPAMTPENPTVTPTPTVPSANRSVSPTPTPDVNRNQNADSPTPRKPILATFVLRPAMRGAGSVQSLAVNAETRETVFKLMLEPNDFDSFEAVLADESGGRSFWSGKRLKATGGALTVSVKAELPRNQVLIFKVKGVREGESEPLGTYVFRLENR